MRVSLMSQRKYDSGVTKGTSSSRVLVRPEPSLKKSNISKMQILLSHSLLFSTITGAFSSASSVYPQSVYWPASLPLSLWSDLLDKNGKKRGTSVFQEPMADWWKYLIWRHTYRQSEIQGKHGLWNAVMTISLSHSFFFYPFIPLTSLHPASSSWHGRRAERQILSPTSHHLFLILFTLCFLFFSTVPLLSCSFLPSPHCFCIFNRSTISYVCPPPVSFLIMSVFQMLLTVNTRREPICQAKCFLAAGWKACGADLKSRAICYLIGYAVCVDFSYRGEQGDNGTVSATSGIPEARRKWKTTASQTFECL